MANASEIFEGLSRKFSKTVDKAAKKTDEFISVQKVKSRMTTLENQKRNTYRTIGQMVFEEYEKGNPISEEMAKLCEKIKKLQKEIDSCSSEIADIKGVKVCDSCGSPIPEEADFCMKCGSPKPEEEVEDAVFEESEPVEESEEMTDEPTEEEPAAEEEEVSEEKAEE